MNKICKKVLCFFSATIMASSAVLSASASYQSGKSLGHKNDEWKYGYSLAWYLFESYQYSNFYCADKKHTATAIIVEGSWRDKDVDINEKGKWAKAETHNHRTMDEYNSYYDHRDKK